MTDTTTHRDEQRLEHPGSAMPQATSARLEQDERVRGRNGLRPDNEKSAAELEHEVERERAELSSTINAIRSRLSPGQLLDQALDYAKHSGGREFAGNLGRNLRDNPLPVLLVGAGIAWLMSSNGQAGSGRAGDAVSGAATGMRDGAASARSSLSDAAGRASATAAGVASSVRDTLDRTFRAGSDLAGSTAEGAGRAGEAARDGFREATHRAGSFAHDAGDTLGHSAERVRHGWSHLAGEQPLVLGAIGLAVGAAIATALPSTRTEDRLMGEASDAVKGRIGETAHRQFEHAKQVASETYEDMAEDLDKKGLSVDAAADAAASSAEKVHGAMDKIAEGVEKEVEGRDDKGAKNDKGARTASPGAQSSASRQSAAGAERAEPPKPQADKAGAAPPSRGTASGRTEK